MTDQEIDILKKYYEIIKPKVSVSAASEPEDTGVKEDYKPIVYDTGKVSFVSLQELKKFLDTYKKDIEGGVYEIEYDTHSTPSGFVLKKPSDDSVIKFPNAINDTFFAVALTTTDKENSKMYEANLYRVVNWNDANKKLSSGIANKRVRKSSLIGDFFSTENRKNNRPTIGSEPDSDKLPLMPRIVNENPKLSDSPSLTSNSISPANSSSSSALSFEYIRSLSSLVNSIIQPKLLKQLTFNGVDLR